VKYLGAACGPEVKPVEHSSTICLPAGAPFDQLYDTRQRLFSLARAIKAQDETVQLAIAAATSPESKLNS